MYPGRSEQQKARLAGAIVKDDMAITDNDAVSVTIEEVKADDWAEKVYKTGHRERLRQAILFDRAESGPLISSPRNRIFNG